MDEIFDLQKARAFEHCQEYEHCDADGIIGAACDEIESLRKAISEPLEAFGTPELIAWSQELTRLLDVPEGERGGWPFVLSVGCHLEKFAKSWDSQTMAEKDAEIERLRAENANQKQGISNLQTALVMRDHRIAEQAKLLEEFEDHERQTHEILGAILGTDDSLEECAKRATKRIEELEAALITDRTEKLAIAFVGYEPPMTMEDCERMAREQLKKENLL